MQNGHGKKKNKISIESIQIKVSNQVYSKNIIH